MRWQEGQHRQQKQYNQKGHIMSEVTLSAGIRSNLISLQNTNKLLSQTQTRLATGKKVNSAIDNPNNYFKAASLTDRATGLNGRLDAMG